ncbi:MAG: hypothetical protein WD737_06770 [Gemmatimonadota bacterium]
MKSQPRRILDGFLAIGPHPLDAQLEALSTYAERRGYELGLFWAILPDEDPATAAPDFGVPMVAFDDEIANFTAEEREPSASVEDSPATAIRDWHVAHGVPQQKRPTLHLPVYGSVEEDGIAGDAILCIGLESLDRQIERIEAFAMRSGVTLRAVFVASGPDNLQVLLRDFSASCRALGSAVTLTVGPQTEIQVHG